MLHFLGAMKMNNIKQFLIDRLSESSTWQGLAFILTIVGSHYGANFGIAGATAAGGLVSATIKILFPDNAA